MSQLQQNKEIQSIREVIQLYFESYLGADADGIANAFHSETRLFSVDQGALSKVALADWLPSLRERQKNGDIRQAETSIGLVDVTGDAALAKVTIRFPKFAFTDYLSLLMIEGTWRIIGKIYTVQPH
jgi:hypothetical protein